MELTAYLVALPRDTLDALYESRWTCLAVLRSLPPLGSQYLLRMLLVDVPVTQGALDVWIGSNKTPSVGCKQPRSMRGHGC